MAVFGVTKEGGSLLNLAGSLEVWTRDELAHDPNEAIRDYCERTAIDLIARYRDLRLNTFD